MVKVSVSIPTYNRSNFVNDAIETALNQSYENIEVIVVNDGSTDNTESVLEQYIDDSRVKVYHNETNTGQGAAKMKAASKCSGEYIAFLDDDDLWSPEKIESQVEVLNTLPESYCGVYTGAEVLRDGHVVDSSPAEKRGCLYPEIFLGQPMPTSGTLIRKSCYESVGGYDPKFDRMPDWDLFIRLSKDYMFECIDRNLLKRRLHDGNMVKEVHHGIEGRELIWEKHKEEISKHSRIEENFSITMQRKKGIFHLQQRNRIKSASVHISLFRETYRVKFFLLFLISLIYPAAFTIGSKLIKQIR